MFSHSAKTALDYAEPAARLAGDVANLPLVSVIIVNHKAKGLLKYCLRGLAGVASSFSFEVIVVDNASRDGSVEWLTEYASQIANDPTHRLHDVFFAIKNKDNRGFAAGNNDGIRRARGKYCLIMNPDIVLRDGALEELCTFLDTHPRVAAVGPKLLYPDGTLQYSCFRFPGLMIPLYRRTPLGNLRFAREAVEQYRMADADHAKERAVPWLLGACILIRREAITRVGLMDERFFLYFEDIDWCRRFWASGYEVWYDPHATCTHFHQRLSAEATGISTIFSFATRVHIASGIKYFLKWGTKIQNSEFRIQN